MLPIKDDNPHFLRPISTLAIIFLNFYFWFKYQDAGLGPQLIASVCQMGLIPAYLISGDYPVTEICRGTANPAILTMFSSMFLHGGWLHLLGNMWFLWIFGNNVEDSMGHYRFLMFYLLCGLAAAGLQIWFNPYSAVPMVGASGAIGGVMGAYIVLYPRVRVHILLVIFLYITTIRVPAFLLLAYWFLLQILGGLSSVHPGRGGVAFWAHIGGFIAGMVLIWFFRDRQLVNQHPYRGWRGAEGTTPQGPTVLRSRWRGQS